MSTAATKLAMETLKLAWESKTSPLRQYILYKKAAKLCDTIAQVMQSRANVCYEEHIKKSKTGAAPFEIEGCVIKRYVPPELYEWPEEVLMIAERIESLGKRLAIAKEKVKLEGTALKLPAGDCKTVFTVDASKC
jgi:23S rRNA G2445 N2-methylase RlmL